MLLGADNECWGLKESDGCGVERERERERELSRRNVDAFTVNNGVALSFISRAIAGQME